MKVRMLIVLMGVLILAVTPALAGAAAGPATDTVRQMLDDVMSIQTDPRLLGEQSRETRKGAIQKVIVRGFDIPDMAKEAIGPQWEKLSGPERSEFRRDFPGPLSRFVLAPGPRLPEEREDRSIWPRRLKGTRHW